MATPSNIHAGPLGESTQYQDGYDATHLHPMVRAEGRAAVGLTDAMVFSGEDQWTAYEFSWLDQKVSPEWRNSTSPCPPTRQKLSKANQ